MLRAPGQGVKSAGALGLSEGAANLGERTNIGQYWGGGFEAKLSGGAVAALDGGGRGRHLNTSEPDHTARASWIACTLGLAAQALKFAGVSGVGWLIDFCVFLSLVHAAVMPSFANMASSTLGVSFVYFASVRHIFRYQGRFLWAKWVVYVAFEAFVISSVSAVIGWAGAHLEAPVWLVKIGVTPVTLAANFLFMKALTSRFGARRLNRDFR
jgi:hypothetical protein